MISREKYVKALNIVLQYREQCKNDISDIDAAQSSVILFKEVASPRLYILIKNSLFIPWEHELTLREVRLAVAHAGIEKFRSLRGLGEKLFAEFKNILYNF